MSVIILVTQNWHGSNIPLTYNPSHRSGKFTQMQKCILVACPPKITACIRGNPTKASSVNRDLTPKILPPCKTLHYICEHMTSTTTLHKTILNHNYVEFATCEQNFSPMNSQYICVSQSGRKCVSVAAALRAKQGLCGPIKDCICKIREQ